MIPRAPKELTIPEVRERLYELADEYHSVELRKLADQLWRRPPWRKPVRVQNKRVTEAVRERVRALIEQYPNMPEDHIATLAGVNQGRVSEIMAGIRGVR